MKLRELEYCSARVHCSKTAADNFLFIFFLGLIVVSSALGQERVSGTDLRSINKVLGCEETVALQDVIVTEALRLLGTESVLFVVVRPGARENFEKLTNQRLFLARQYFRERGRRLNADKSIVVLGPPTSGAGRLEYYINGELYLRLLYPKNGYVCHN